jgi:predicted transcriptional regulator
VQIALKDAQSSSHAKLIKAMAIDDPLDAAEDRIAAEQRSESALAPYGRDVSEIFGALPAELVPSGLAGPLDLFKSFLKAVAWRLRKTEDGRRRYLVDVVVHELRWLRNQVDHLDEKHITFMREEFEGLVIDALQKAERTRSMDRVARMGRVLGASARKGPAVAADEVEELLRVSMDLDDTDVKVLGALVEGQRELLARTTGMVTPGQANKFWQRAGRVSDSGGLSEIAARLGISDGALQSACAKLQAYGLLVQVERDESKLGRGTILYSILPRAVTFIDAIAS